VRNVEEWIGKNDDQAIPARVKVRIFLKHNERCAECLRSIRGKLRAEYDHILALCNGGGHRESNIWLLCNECHSAKTKTDVAQRSKNFHVIAKHAGIELRKGRKLQSRGFEKRPPQRTASRPIDWRS
jgi:5-methylcytosine-specific restriction protein A